MNHPPEPLPSESADGRFIYVDYNATTPLDPAVRASMVAALDGAWGNPSSVHQAGRQARLLLDEARERVALVLACKPSELVFTSGGTEANNLAIFGGVLAHQDRGRHLVCSPVEHPAVLHAFERLARDLGFSLTLLPVDASGSVALEDVAAAVRADTVLVSVMAANNEVGTLQPVQEIGRFCRDRGVLFHTDAVQWFGKEPFDAIGEFSADFVTLCAHKIHGPRGAGLLFVRSPLRLHPMIVGGSHENERRAGTENVPAIVGLAEAVSRFVARPVFDQQQLRVWTTRLRSALTAIEGVVVQGPPDRVLANTVAFTVEGADSISVLAALDLAGVGASSGSACSVGSLQPSHVLLAMGASRAAAASLVRLSLGRETTESEVQRLCLILPEVIRQVRTT